METTSGTLVGTPASYSKALRHLFFLRRVLDREGVKKRFYTRTESRRRRPPVGTTVLLNQRNPSVSATPPVFRYERKHLSPLLHSFAYANLSKSSKIERKRERERVTACICTYHVIFRAFFTADTGCVIYSRDKSYTLCAREA